MSSGQCYHVVACHLAVGLRQCSHKPTTLPELLSSLALLALVEFPLMTVSRVCEAAVEEVETVAAEEEEKEEEERDGGEVVGVLSVLWYHLLFLLLFTGESLAFELLYMT